MKKNICIVIKYTVFIIIIFLLLTFKLVKNKLGIGFFQWLLVPTTFIVEIFTGNIFVFNSEVGYINLSETIIINQSCSGVNLFILLTFLSMYFLFQKKINESDQLLYLIPYIFFAYCFTVFSNAVRISFSILFEPIRLNSLILLSANNWIHLGIGTFTFLVSVLIYYFLLLRGKVWIKRIFS